MTVGSGGNPVRGQDKPGAAKRRLRGAARSVATPSASGEGDAPDLHVPVPRSVPFAQAAGENAGVKDLLAVMGRHTALIAFVVLCSFAAGAAYVLLAPPRYVATATVLVNPDDRRGLGGESAGAPDEYRIEGQTQILRSDTVARIVVEELDLVNAGIEEDNDAFLLDQIRAVREVVGEFIPSLSRKPKDGDAVQSAILTVRRNLSISRPAMTQVITVSYDSTSPTRASAVVNGLIQAYASERRNREASSAQQSVEWLSGRLSELRQRFEAADLAVEEFKTANNIMGAGTNQNLLAEQRLYDLTSQLD